MKAIQKRRNGCAILFVTSICFTVWFAVKLMAEAALILGALNIALFILLLRQSRLFRGASLILDNRILTVPLAVASISGGKEKRDAEEIVVSTFGIMMGSKIYKWGCDGVRGVRLRTIRIDRSRIYLSFGDGIDTMRVEFLHGMADKQEVMNVKQKIWRETGVQAVVSGW